MRATLGGFSASCTNQLPTVMTEIDCDTLLALLTLGFLRLFDFLYGITNLKEIVEVKSAIVAEM